MPNPERKPLEPLPLLPYLVAASSSSSPNKTRRTPSSSSALASKSMSLLPSPFSSGAATPHTQPAGPLSTLYEAPRLGASASTSALASPSRRMMDDDDAQTRADDELPQSSPRRLFDAFTASTSPAKTRSPRLRTAMLPPQSPRRSAVAAKEEEPVLPAWSFYEDGDEMDASFAPAMSATPLVPVSDAEVVEEPQPVDKENTRPPRRPRRRSTSVVSTTSTLNRSPPAVSPTQVATSSTLAGSSAQPSPTRAATAPASPSAPHTPPALASPSLSLAFPASASAASTPFFAEMGPTSFAAMATSSVGGSEEPGGGGAGFLGLLPAFSAAAAGEPGHEDIGHGRHRGKKRESLEEPGGPGAEAKRARKDEAS